MKKLLKLVALGGAILCVTAAYVAMEKRRFSVQQQG